MNAKDEKCTVIENKNIKKNYFLMKLKADHISSHSEPGNFLMLSASSSFDPILKRPFGILKAEPPYLWLLYEVVGRGTELISKLSENTEVDAIGPLGNSFPSYRNKNILMVAGGRGIVPIFYAMTRLAPSNNVFLIYGARSAQDINLRDEIEALQLKNKYFYTDDGSSDKKGVVTTDILEIISRNNIEITFSCGPDKMFKHLAQILKDSKTENYVSMESIMGCGFGICYSCAVRMNSNEYKKVCADGPIFKMENVAW